MTRGIILAFLLATQLMSMVLSHRNPLVSTLSVSPACQSCELALRLVSDGLCDPGAEEYLVWIMTQHPSTNRSSTTLVQAWSWPARIADAPVLLCASEKHRLLNGSMTVVFYDRLDSFRRRCVPQHPTCSRYVLQPSTGSSSPPSTPYLCYIADCTL